MTKIELYFRDTHKTFEFKELNEGMWAMLQLAVLSVVTKKEGVIVLMDEANWQKMVKNHEN